MRIGFTPNISPMILRKNVKAQNHFGDARLYVNLASDENQAALSGLVKHYDSNECRALLGGNNQVSRRRIVTMAIEGGKANKGEWPENTPDTPMRSNVVLENESTTANERAVLNTILSEAQSRGLIQEVK